MGPIDQIEDDGTYTQAVPCALNVTSYPFLDRLDIFLGVLKIVSDVRLVAVQDIGLGSPGRRGVKGTPATVLKASTQVAGECVTLSRLEVHVVSTGRRVVIEEWMHRLNLASVGVHATRRLSRFDVAPDHGRHVSLIVHKARVKVGTLVRVGRLDVREASRERVLQEVEHGEEISRWPTRYVSKVSGPHPNWGSLT